jgi:nitrogen-specific signal transduction histidine kinase
MEDKRYSGHDIRNGHGRTEAFDENDARLMTTLADFAAVGYRQQKQRAQFIIQERAVAVAKMASHLAHEINNPLQSMTNAAFLIAEGKPDCDSKVLGRGPLLATI